MSLLHPMDEFAPSYENFASGGTMSGLSPSKNNQRDVEMNIISEIFMWSLLTAEGGLLISLYADKPLLTIPGMPLMLLAAFIFGNKFLSARNCWLTTHFNPVLCGFSVCAAGMLLIMLSITISRGNPGVLSGVIISGIGYSMIYTANKQHHNKRENYGYWRIRYLTILFSIMLTAVALLSQSGFQGAKDAARGFAIVLDVSLLGLVYIKIRRDDCAINLTK
ncbi:hypothetical protein [Superficieibacter sp. 1612_C1]|uniref:hypothetical protein n=1 Tax=Superficieibacter sp. 1612_C1 TaxID=2780382 RepID=UPI0018837B27|nr:hypothetical protein [Superficieibacter sp. 1612_C1]